MSDLHCLAKATRPRWPEGVVNVRIYVRPPGDGCWHYSGSLTFAESEWKVVAERLEAADFAVEEGS